MHDRFVANGITPPAARDDYWWADLVQFVIRQAKAVVTEGETQTSGYAESDAESGANLGGVSL